MEQAQQELCSSCNGTGDLITLDGYWVGYCTCCDGLKLKKLTNTAPTEATSSTN